MYATGEVRHYARAIYFPDFVIEIIGQINVFRVVNGQIRDEIDLRTGGRPVVAGVPLHSSARDGGDDPAGVNLANAIIEAIRDVQVAMAIHRDGHRINLRGDRRTIVSSELRISVPSHRIDSAIHRYAANYEIARVGDIQIPLGVQRDAAGEVERSARRGSAVATVSGNARACVSADNAG